MRQQRQVDKQMPDQVVVAESLLRINDRSGRIEDPAQQDQQQQRQRSVPNQPGQEKDRRPAHHQINRQAQRRDGTPGQRLIQNTQQNGRPLQNGDEDTLPAADHEQRYGGIGSGDGDEDEDMVELVENGLVLRIRAVIEW